MVARSGIKNGRHSGIELAAFVLKSKSSANWAILTDPRNRV